MMAATQDKQPRRSTARVVRPGSQSARTPTKAVRRKPYSPPSLVDRDREHDDNATKPTPNLDELLGPHRPVDYSDEPF